MEYLIAPEFYTRVYVVSKLKSIVVKRKAKTQNAPRHR